MHVCLDIRVLAVETSTKQKTFTLFSSTQKQHATEMPNSLDSPSTGQQVSHPFYPPAASFSSTPPSIRREYQPLGTTFLFAFHNSNLRACIRTILASLLALRDLLTNFLPLLLTSCINYQLVCPASLTTVRI